MEIAELVLKFVDTLAWPLVALGLAWAWRTNIGRAIGRMTRVETPAGALEFAAEVADIRREAQYVIPAAATLPEQAAEAEPRDEDQEADDSPDTPSPDTHVWRLGAVPAPRPAPGGYGHPAAGAPAMAAGPSLQRVAFPLGEVPAMSGAYREISRHPGQAMNTAWEQLINLGASTLHVLPIMPPRLMAQELGLSLHLTPEAVQLMLDLERLHNRSRQQSTQVNAEAAQGFVEMCELVYWLLAGSPIPSGT
ncbi:hypothetical protein OHA37_20310 [Streptomyces sp. NBC_00335]|uniref:hypothetical protein n=1 Tax=unclassified Streptomyces TaxID=2593676 RepID=UPI00225AB77E|nr:MULTISPECIES: hypothetical protein [unclassified Streptomyces]MCX5406207.1 hypothetical protein [Streptomyces sp. NBC_00086]